MNPVSPLPENPPEIDLIYQHLLYAERQFAVRKLIDILRRVAPSEFDSRDDVFADLYVYLREKEGVIFSDDVVYHQKYVVTTVTNRLKDLVEKHRRRLARFIPSGSLDDLAEGKRVPYESSLKEVLLREEVEHLLNKTEDGWRKQVLIDTIILSGEVAVSDEVASATVEALREKWEATPEAHRIPVRDVCSAYGVSPSTATRFVRELRKHFVRRAA